MGRTRLANFSALVALVVPSLAVALLGWESVRRVADVSPIPRGVPMPVLPNLELFSVELRLSAFALAVVIAVQGAGVSQSVENPDDKRVSPSRDLLAQCAANVGSGLRAVAVCPLEFAGVFCDRRPRNRARWTADDARGSVNQHRRHLFERLCKDDFAASHESTALADPERSCSRFVRLRLAAPVASVRGSVGIGTGVSANGGTLIYRSSFRVMRVASRMRFASLTFSRSAAGFVIVR